MKITLKRVLLCGICLVGSIMFLIALAIPFKVLYVEDLFNKGKFLKEVSASFFNCIGGKPFHDVFVYNNTAEAALIPSAAANNPEKFTKIVNNADSAMKIFALIGLFAIIADMLATIGAFFLKDNKKARKLVIVFKVIAIVCLFSTLAIPGSQLSHGISVENTKYQFSTVEEGGVFALYFIGILCFVGALIASGVAKDKVLFESKKK